MTVTRQGSADDSGAAPADNGLAAWEEASGPERDFGDSAGYGTGGSTRDYYDVVGDDGRRKRPNPLDRVMGGSPDRSVTGPVLIALTILTIPLGFYLWHKSQPQRERERAARQGRNREALARFQV